MRWWRSDQSRAPQSSVSGGTGSKRARSSLSSGSAGSASSGGYGSARFVPSASTRPGNDRTIIESVIALHPVVVGERLSKQSVLVQGLAVEVAREDEPDLGEDLEVAARD